MIRRTELLDSTSVDQMTDRERRVFDGSQKAGRAARARWTALVRDHRDKARAARHH